MPDWDRAFLNTNCIFILNKTISNIFPNFILNETLPVNEKDVPWITKKKNLIQGKSIVYKTFEIVKTIITYNT